MIGIAIANSLGLSATAAAPDPSASAYFAATGITGMTQQQAIDNLVKGLKSDGLWSKMKAVYPFVTDNRNLLGYTEDFSNAYWSKLQNTVTSNATTAPDGTLTADAIFETAVTNFHGVENASSFALTIGSTYTQSIYVKPIGRRYIALTTQWGAGTLGAWFDTDTASVFSQDAGITANISTASNGFYRITITRTTSSATGFMNVWFDNSTPTAGVYFTGNTYLGDVTKGFYLWGAQLELGSTATTYQPIATTQQAFVSNQFKYNLKDPRDTDSAFRLVFNGGWSFSSTGATPNGVNGYADTKLVPSSVLAQNSASLSLYSRTNNTALIDRIEMGSSNVTVDIAQAIRWNGTLGNLSRINNGYIVGTSGYIPTKTSGLFAVSRTSSTITKKYEDGILKETTADPSAAPNSFSIYLGSRNNSGTPAFYDVKQYAFDSIGDGLTDTEVANLYTRVQAFQTALSRQV